MISVEEARGRILADLRAVGAETIALSTAWNRVLAAPVVARLTQPPAPMSVMDGYALRAADGSAGAVLPVVGSAPAGHPYAGVVPAGAAIRLFTGSVMPDGADCVVMQEDVARDGTHITLREAAVAGRFIRPLGQDFSAGDTLLAAGRRLTPRAIGLAAAANAPWLVVHRRPRIALLATGDEIVLPGEPVPAGGIVSSNTHALAALVEAAGGVAVLLPIVRDDRAAIAAVVDQLGGCDMLVTSGGASVGEHDLIQSALGDRGLVLDFWKIAMRPGKPLIHGRLGALPMLGLPGNPVSALVCAALFLWPAIARLAGVEAAAPPTERARLTRGLPANDQRADFLRGRLERGEDGALEATAMPDQASSLMRTLAQADALLLRAPFAAAAEAGSMVDVIRLDGLGL